MKLVRYGERGEERPGLVDADGGVRDLSAQLADITPVALAPESLAMLARLDAGSLPRVRQDVRLGVPVAGIGKLVCVGLNYADHAAEAGLRLPKEPILFMKASSALNGANDDIVLPRGSLKGDWEVELGVFIGSRASHVESGSALEHVAGYCVANDVSERAYQTERSGQWTKGKSCDTFAPVGPWLVTTDEVAEPQSLHLWLDLNGERAQDGNTATMVFGVAHLVSYISQFMSLHPGDLILSGTPPGVGMGRKPPRFLRPGDQLTLGIDGLGEQRARVLAASS